MSISKKIRFDVFKRDGFVCAYCGNHPPKVTLEVDHIHPVSKGGKDSIDNLVTSCFDCNRGKSNRELTSIPQSVSDKADALKEREQQLKEYQKILRAIDKRISDECEKVHDAFCEHFQDYHLKEVFIRSSVVKFIKQLGVYDVVDAMHTACDKIRYDHEKAIKYFCGICWNKIKNQNG